MYTRALILLFAAGTYGCSGEGSRVETIVVGGDPERGRAALDPDNLLRWVQNPQAVEPGTAMPDLGVGPAVARDIAAYLYTLR